jgi:hypothetical protein
MKHSAPPPWLEAIGWIALGLAAASALAIAFDVFIRGHRQRMTVMDAVYPISALYWGPVALWFYYVYGRMDSRKVLAEHQRIGHGPVRAGDKVPWWQTAKGVTHCGAGCTLGDIAGEWIVYATGWTLFGAALYSDYLLDFAFAWSLGVVFQYFSIMPMRDVSRSQGIWAAIKADTLSIAAFQAGLFGGMAVYQLVLFDPPLAKTTSSYWFLMQLSMIAGFFTAYPVNGWLIRRGWKEKM